MGGASSAGHRFGSCAGFVLGSFILAGNVKPGTVTRAGAWNTITDETLQRKT